MSFWRVSPVRAALGACLLLLAVVCRPGSARADWLADLRAYAASAMDEFGTPGWAMVIVVNDVVILAEGHGLLRSDAPAPVDADSLFLLGSTTKGFTAGLIASLVDQNLLAWDTLVKDKLPEFRMADPDVTAQFAVDDLLAHRSGMPEDALTLMEFLNYPTQTRLRGMRFVTPVTSFRASYAYQNVTFTTASRLAETVTGQSFEASLKANLFDKLGMTRSCASQATVVQMDNVAVNHLKLTSGYWPIPSDWFWFQAQDRAMGAVAVRSSANDLGQWLRFNLSQGRLGTSRVVAQEAMRHLQAPKILMNPWTNLGMSTHWGPMSYCSGWMRVDFSPQPILFHEGAAMGSASAILLAPDANVGIAVLSNVTGGSIPADKIVLKFYELYFGSSPAATRQLLGTLEQLRPDAPAPVSAPTAPGEAASPARPLAAYCGAYSNPAYGVFPVSLVGDHLEMTMGPNQYTASLVSTGGDAFSAVMPGYPQGNVPQIVMPVVFEFASGGPVVAKLGPMYHGPQEVFTRIAPGVPANALLLDQN